MDVFKNLYVYILCYFVGDLVGFLDVFEEKCVFVVGYDWGVKFVWDFCLLRLDCVKVVICLSVLFFF